MMVALQMLWTPLPSFSVDNALRMTVDYMEQSSGHRHANVEEPLHQRHLDVDLIAFWN